MTFSFFCAVLLYKSEGNDRHEMGYIRIRRKEEEEEEEEKSPGVREGEQHQSSTARKNGKERSLLLSPCTFTESNIS